MDDTVADASLPLHEWLARAAAKRPTPGGGAVAALVGALAASMGEMTLQYSVGRKANRAEDEPRLAAALAELTRARGVLVELMTEDQRAFAGWQAARSRSAEERADAARASALVPMAVAAACAELLRVAGEVAPVANPYLLSDLAVCGELTRAAARCAALNVDANLRELPADEAAGVRVELRATLAHVEERAGELLSALATRGA